MEVISGTKEFKLNNTAVTLGKFDGMHKGHMSLLREVIKSKEDGLTPVLFTFDTSPYEVVDGRKMKYILDCREKYDICRNEGIEVVIEYPFDKDTMSMDADEFVSKVLLEKLGAKKIVVGRDFNFGRDRKGNTEMLSEMSDKYELLVKEKILFDNKEISSTIIRKYIQDGQIEKANRMLGRMFSITGIIVCGRKIGRTLGFPTINLKVSDEKILPRFGVYASIAEIDNKIYKGITNIGFNPTVSSEDSIKAETHLLDCNEDLYGRKAEIKLFKYIRDEKKFNSLDELKNQIKDDIKFTESLDTFKYCDIICS